MGTDRRDNPDNLTIYELADMFGLTPSAVSLIQTGKTYQNEGGIVRKKQKHPRNYIPDEIRAAIRADRATGQYTKADLARKYGYCHETIRKIINESAE